MPNATPDNIEATFTPGPNRTVIAKLDAGDAKYALTLHPDDNAPCRIEVTSCVTPEYTWEEGMPEPNNETGPMSARLPNNIVDICHIAYENMRARGKLIDKTTH